MGRHFGSGHLQEIREKIAETMFKGLPKKAVCSQCQQEKEIDRFYRCKTQKQKLETYDSKYKACSRREGRKRYAEKTVLQRKDKALRANFGITLVDYDRMYQVQSGRCLICNRHQAEVNRTFCVDHNHTTGRVRGLLCYKCNSGIGLLNDNPELLKKAIIYLTEGVNL